MWNDAALAADLCRKFLRHNVRQLEWCVSINSTAYVIISLHLPVDHQLYMSATAVSSRAVLDSEEVLTYVVNDLVAKLARAAFIVTEDEGEDAEHALLT